MSHSQVPLGRWRTFALRSKASACPTAVRITGARPVTTEDKHGYELRGLGITFIVTGLMGIGFLSFGGMLTGGDEEVKETPKEVVTETLEIEKEVDNQIKTVN